MSARFLVTGGTGTLGSIICQHRLAARYRVTVVDNLMYGQQSLFHFCGDPNFDFVFGCVRDEKRICPFIL